MEWKYFQYNSLTFSTCWVSFLGRKTVSFKVMNSNFNIIFIQSYLVFNNIFKTLAQKCYVIHRSWNFFFSWKMLSWSNFFYVDSYLFRMIQRTFKSKEFIMFIQFMFSLTLISSPNLIRCGQSSVSWGSSWSNKLNSKRINVYIKSTLVFLRGTHGSCSEDLEMNELKR